MSRASSVTLKERSSPFRKVGGMRASQYVAIRAVASLFDFEEHNYGRKRCLWGRKLRTYRDDNPSRCSDDAEAADVTIHMERNNLSGNGALLVDVTTTVHEKLIVELAAQHRLPGIYPWRHFVTLGVMMSYAADLPNLWRRAASYVDRVLKGEKPADLPVQRPTKFELVINLTAAKAIGPTIPASIPSLADDLVD
jgi:hypothetical protein